MSESKKTLTISQAAERMDVSERTVRELCQKYYLDAEKIGRTWQISIDSVDSWIKKPVYLPKPFYERHWFLAIAAIIGLLASIFGFFADSGLIGSTATPTVSSTALAIQPTVTPSPIPPSPTFIETPTIISTPTKVSDQKFISGRILNADSPLVDMPVHLYDKAGKLQSVKTNNDGEYVFTNLNQGEYFIDFSTESGVGIIPTAITSGDTSVYVPIQVADLIRVTFVYDDQIPFELLVDGRRMLLVYDGKVTASNDDDYMIIGKRGFESVFFFTRGIHSYEYHEIRANDDQKNMIPSNPYENGDNGFIDYQRTRKLGGETRAFESNEDIYLFKKLKIASMDFNDKPTLLVENDTGGSYIEFLLNVQSLGYTNALFKAVIKFSTLDSNQLVDDKTYEVPFRIENQFQEDEIPFHIPLNDFSPFDFKLSVTFVLLSTDDEPLTEEVTVYALFFREYSRFDIIVPEVTSIYGLTSNQVLNNLFWVHKDLEFEQVFADAEEVPNLTFRDQGDGWSGNIKNTSYTLTNTLESTSTKILPLYFEQNNDSHNEPSSFDHPVSVTTWGEYNQALSGSGLVYRYDSDTNSYYAYMLTGEGLLKLYAVSNSNFKEIYAVLPHNLNEHKPNEIGILGHESIIYLFCNGELIDTVTDESVTGIGTGLVGRGAGEFGFDNFRVYKNSYTPD